MERRILNRNQVYFILENDPLLSPTGCSFCQRSRFVHSVLHLVVCTQGRDDDNIDTVRRRFQVFQESTMPVVQYYEKSGKLRRVIFVRFLTVHNTILPSGSTKYNMFLLWIKLQLTPGVLFGNSTIFVYRRPMLIR
jgi:hypothetical protein